MIQSAVELFKRLSCFIFSSIFAVVVVNNCVFPLALRDFATETAVSFPYPHLCGFVCYKTSKRSLGDCESFVMIWNEYFRMQDVVLKGHNCYVLKGPSALETGETDGLFQSYLWSQSLYSNDVDDSHSSCVTTRTPA